LRKNAITCECYGVAAMARREGRERRQRSPSAQQEQDDDDYNVNLSPLRTAAPAARWNDERLIIVCQAVINAPASLYRRNANWGKPVPPGINYLNVFNVKLTHTFLAGRPRQPKNCIENIEYGDLTDVYNKALENLNDNQSYLVISNNLPISLSVLRTKVAELLAMATRLLANYESVDAALLEGQTELVELAISLKTKIDKSTERRTRNHVTISLIFVLV
jgi:hypothetical protein